MGFLGKLFGVRKKKKKPSRKVVKKAVAAVAKPQDLPTRIFWGMMASDRNSGSLGQYVGEGVTQAVQRGPGILRVLSHGLANSTGFVGCTSLHIAGLKGL